MRGVLFPPEGSNLESRIGPTGALQIQADYFNNAIGETVDRVNDVQGVTEYNAVIERIEGLKVARDKTLEQRALEEAREEQLNDISRFRRFKEWLGEEKVGLVGIAVSTAGLITTLLIHARGEIVGTAKTTSKVAKALANIAKKRCSNSCASSERHCNRTIMGCQRYCLVGFTLVGISCNGSLDSIQLLHKVD